MMQLHQAVHDREITVNELSDIAKLSTADLEAKTNDLLVGNKKNHCSWICIQATD
ncbi:hypothetical protein [Legionella massiliensis]|uniref:hypothetical protein n=1 Tax=Legionella massiliensis TaxID=1034943 RepID=UPI000A74EE0C|nr:hypothetical protein [Legionella massiliensis]